MKGQRLASEQIARAVSLYVMGYTFAYIEAETGVSRAALSGIIAERSQADPLLPRLHELAVWLRDNKRAPETLLRGIAIEEKVEEAGCSLDKVVEVVYPFLEKYGSDAPRLAEEGRIYCEAVGPSGLTLTEAISAHQKAVAGRDRALKGAEEAEARAETLASEIERLEERLGDLKTLRNMRERLEGAGVSLAHASKVLGLCESLLARGLSNSVLERVADEIERTSAKGVSAPRRIAELVSQFGSLEVAVREEERRVSRLEHQEERLGVKISYLRSKKISLGDVVSDLEVRTDRLRVGFERLSSIYAGRERELERAFAMKKDSIETEIDDKVNAANARLLDLERLARLKEDRISKLDDEAERKNGLIVAAVSLWSFVEGGSPTRLSQLKALYGQNGPYRGSDLPESVRNRFLEAIEAASTADIRKRLGEANGRLAEVWESTRQILRRTVIIEKGANRNLAMLQRASARYRATNGSLESVAELLLADPQYIARIMSDAPDSLIYRSFFQMSPQGRDRVTEIVARADNDAELEISRELDRRLDQIINDTVKGLERSVFSLTASFAPPMNRILNAAPSLSP